MQLSLLPFFTPTSTPRLSKFVSNKTLRVENPDSESIGACEQKAPFLRRLFDHFFHEESYDVIRCHTFDYLKYQCKIQSKIKDQSGFVTVINKDALSH